MFETRKRTALERLSDTVARRRHGPRYRDRSWSLADRRRAVRRARGIRTSFIAVLIFALGAGTGAGLHAWKSDGIAGATAQRASERGDEAPWPAARPLAYLTEAGVAPRAGEISGAIALIPLGPANDETVDVVTDDAVEVRGAPAIAEVDPTGPSPGATGAETGRLSAQADVEGVAESIGDEARQPPSVLTLQQMAARTREEGGSAAIINDPPPDDRPAPALVPAAAPLVGGAEPAWRQHAVSVAIEPGRPMISIVIDDMGLNRRGSLRAMELPAPVTLSFLTYAEGLPRMTRQARQAGHELMLHVPMEPIDGRRNNPGPEALTTALTPAEIARRLEWALGRFDGFVGINNHMGSRFTSSRAGMALVLKELKARELLFLDSVTSETSVALEMARAMDVPTAARDIFLDHEQDREFVWQQLREVEREAQRKGHAIAIGHPHGVTLAALERWIPDARTRGFQFVPVSTIVGRRETGLAFKE